MKNVILFLALFICFLGIGLSLFKYNSRPEKTVGEGETVLCKKVTARTYYCRKMESEEKP